MELYNHIGYESKKNLSPHSGSYKAKGSIIFLFIILLLCLYHVLKIFLCVLSCFSSDLSDKLQNYVVIKFWDICIYIMVRFFNKILISANRYRKIIKSKLQ